MDNQGLLPSLAALHPKAQSLPCKRQRPQHKGNKIPPQEPTSFLDTIHGIISLIKDSNLRNMLLLCFVILETNCHRPCMKTEKNLNSTLNTNTTNPAQTPQLLAKSSQIWSNLGILKKNPPLTNFDYGCKAAEPRQVYFLSL